MIDAAYQHGCDIISKSMKKKEKVAMDIDPEWIVGERQEEFECIICFGMVQNPVQCQSCE